VICKSCGSERHAIDAKFCDNCGEKLYD
jgi:predicted amidophosphoribosyltransferase